MKPWQTVIRDGKASKYAIYRGTQYISRWGRGQDSRYLLVIGEKDCGFFDTPEDAKAEADRLNAQSLAEEMAGQA